MSGLEHIPTTRGARGEPTGRQLAVLRAIADFIASHGFPPSQNDLRAALDVHNIQYYLDVLERKGLVARRPEHPRSLRVLDAGKRAIGMAPVCCMACRGTGRRQEGSR